MSRKPKFWHLIGSRFTASCNQWRPLPLLHWWTAGNIAGLTQLFHVCMTAVFVGNIIMNQTASLPYMVVCGLLPVLMTMKSKSERKIVQRFYCYQPLEDFSLRTNIFSGSRSSCKSIQIDGFLSRVFWTQIISPRKKYHSSLSFQLPKVWKPVSITRTLVRKLWVFLISLFLNQAARLCSLTPPSRGQHIVKA